MKHLFKVGERAIFVCPSNVTRANISIDYREHLDEECTLMRTSYGDWYVRFDTPFGGRLRDDVMVPYQYLAPVMEVDEP